jgi:hypothetical protein
VSTNKWSDDPNAAAKDKSTMADEGDTMFAEGVRDSNPVKVGVGLVKATAGRAAEGVRKAARAINGPKPKE